MATQGHKVDAALNAEAALEKLANNDYHLILGNVRMPGLSDERLYGEINESGSG